MLTGPQQMPVFSNGVLTTGTPQPRYSTALATKAQWVPFDASYGTRPTSAEATCRATSSYGMNPVSSSRILGSFARTLAAKLRSAGVSRPTKRKVVVGRAAKTRATAVRAIEPR